MNPTNYRRKKAITSLFITLSITMIVLLSGCGTDEIEPVETVTTVEETINDATFGYHVDEKVLYATRNRQYIIQTDTQTYAWDDTQVTFVASENETDTLTYKRDANGYMFDIHIHLSPEGLKKYSDPYAYTFNETLTLNMTPADK